MPDVSTVLIVKQNLMWFKHQEKLWLFNTSVENVFTFCYLPNHENFIIVLKPILMSCLPQTKTNKSKYQLSYRHHAPF